MGVGAAEKSEENQSNFDFIDENVSSANRDARVSSLDEVKALIAKKHDGKGIGSDDPIWLLHTMFEVFASDLSALLSHAETQQTAERDKLKTLVAESAQVLAEQLQGELSALSDAVANIQRNVESSSIEGLLKQQAQFSTQLADLTSKLKRFSLPIYFFTALNWVAVGALYLIMK